MSRLSKLMLLLVLTLFVLACNTVTQPFRDAQDAVSTVQSIATAMPLETLQSLATSIPVETLQALPSAMPELDNIVNPQGEPLTEWKGIPVMPEATSGEETGDVYSFKADATVKEVFDYYEAEMEKLGWKEIFTMPDAGGSAILSLEKDGSFVSVTITADPVDGGVLVLLTSQ